MRERESNTILYTHIIDDIITINLFFIQTIFFKGYCTLRTGSKKKKEKKKAQTTCM